MPGPTLALREQLVEDRADGEHAGARVALGALALLRGEAGAVAREGRRGVGAVLGDLGAAARRERSDEGWTKSVAPWAWSCGELGAERDDDADRLLHG